MPGDLWLPIPSDDAVRLFRELVRDRLGMELDDATARDEATRVLHMVYLKEHVFPRMRDEPQPSPETGGAQPASRPRPKVGRPRKAATAGRADTKAQPTRAEPAEAVVASTVDASALAVGETVTLYRGRAA